jgi:aminoglycoside/choline kinase family phosphotransferase
MSGNTSILNTLFRQWSGKEAIKTEILPASGSDRVYYRISGQNITAIGAWNPDKRENAAFTAFSRHFAAKGLPVPEVFLNDESGMAYLQTDLGDQNLFGILSDEGLSERVKELYRQVVHWLPRFQISGGEGLGYSLCYPRQAFDRQSMMWDLNYFKYYFVRLSGFNFDEQALEDDFDRLTSFLLQADSDYFLYRDFQSRNIMISGGRPFFIDFQGGRKGPLQYDIASLLFDAKANLPNIFRNELLNLYIQEASALTEINKELFLKYYHGFVLIRILQALGAYGFRGFYQKKEHFLQSIPFALDNLDHLLTHHHPETEMPALEKLLHRFITSESLRSHAKPALKVSVKSFSYRNSIPEDPTGNGGGFVFDCRALPNPGRLDEYKKLSGQDDPVIRYLSAQPETGIFLASVFTLVDQAVENYISRGFEHLMVSFGCTGGQHRSVYCAGQLAKHLNKRFGMQIQPDHTQRANWIA